MAKRNSDLVGKRFGRLTVLEMTDGRWNGYIVWRCVCDCGNETLADTKRLKRGTISDCGCITKESARCGIKAEDLAGQRFGNLTVLSRAENQKGRTCWNCLCDCGGKKIVAARSLKTGRATSCGCLSTGLDHAKLDLAGQQFGRLTALYPTHEKNKKSSLYWHCRCACGKELDVPRDALQSGARKSCGCLQQKSWEDIKNRLTRVDGTCIEWLEKRKYRCDNTSGFRGVNRIKQGGYRVTIGFKGKRFYIGKYRTFQEAVQARMEAEKLVHEGFVNRYRLWQQRAEKDADWGTQNPLVFEVERKNGHLQIISNINA